MTVTPCPRTVRRSDGSIGAFVQDKELRMKKLVTTIVAGLFALSATAAFAQAKKEETKKEETKKEQTKKKEKKGGC